MQFIGHEISGISQARNSWLYRSPLVTQNIYFFLNAGTFFSPLWNFWSSSFQLTFAFEANLVEIVKIAELVIVANVSLLKIESNKTSRITKDRNALPLNSQCFLVLQYCCQICQICTNLYHVCLDWSQNCQSQVSPMILFQSVTRCNQRQFHCYFLACQWVPINPHVCKRKPNDLKKDRRVIAHW